MLYPSVAQIECRSSLYLPSVSLRLHSQLRLCNVTSVGLLRCMTCWNYTTRAKQCAPTPVFDAPASVCLIRIAWRSEEAAQSQKGYLPWIKVDPTSDKLLIVICIRYCLIE